MSVELTYVAEVGGQGLGLADDGVPARQHLRQNLYFYNHCGDFTGIYREHERARGLLGQHYQADLGACVSGEAEAVRVDERQAVGLVDVREVFDFDFKIVALAGVCLGRDLEAEVIVLGHACGTGGGH